MLAACSADNFQNSANFSSTAVKNEVEFGPKLSFEPYLMALDMEQNEKGDHFLKIDIELFGDAYFISPLTKGDYSGLLSIKFDENDSIYLSNGGLTESPNSVEEINKFNGEVASYVRANTSYLQKVVLPSKGDFKSRGKIQFVIEPNCTLEHIYFEIESKDGKLKIKEVPAGC